MIDTAPTQQHPVFTPKFFEDTYASSRESARAVVPKVVELLHPASVVDVGCGTGAWMAEFSRAGVVKVSGIDGRWIDPAVMRVADSSVIRRHLALPLDITDQFALAVCLEVAQTLENEHADQLIASLVSLATLVLFSAAPPGQGGFGHVNEQPIQWWQDRFQQYGYRLVSPIGRMFAQDPKVSWWYSNNMVLFAADGPFYDSASVALKIEEAPNETDEAPGVIQAAKVLPVILSCAKDLGLFERFTASYRQHVQESFPSGVVVVDTSAHPRLPASYLRTLNELMPRSVFVHSRVHGASPYDSVQNAAFFVLSRGLQEASGKEEFLLFLEDDVIFSSRFVEHLAQAEIGPRMGFYSLYSPGNEYGRNPIDPHRFYGTQAVLFPLEVARLLVQNQAQIEKDFRPGYDIRWSRFLASRGYQLYASRRSYCQHIGIDSRLGCMGHTSHNFEP